MALLLSSNTLHLTLGVLYAMGNLCFFVSLSNSIIAIAFLDKCDKPVYSLSVLLRHTSVWSCEFHTIGYPLYLIMYPRRDLVLSQPLSTSFASQLPTKSALTYISKPFVLGFNIEPFV